MNKHQLPPIYRAEKALDELEIVTLECTRKGGAEAQRLVELVDEPRTQFWKHMREDAADGRERRSAAVRAECQRRQ